MSDAKVEGSGDSRPISEEELAILDRAVDQVLFAAAFLPVTGRELRAQLQGSHEEKRMFGPRALTEKGLERFRREIEAFGRVRHPCVARILDSSPAGELFLVTEVARFGSLHDARAAFRGDLWRCLRMARDVASGLAAVHAMKLVHRDVKPRNILLTTLDHAVVADFGIAHFEDLDTVTSLDSHPGAFLFAPPEYEVHHEPTAAFDAFSLGAVLRWAATGEEPKEPYRVSRNLPTIQSILGTQRASTVDALVRDMTNPDSARRLQSMGDIVGRIDEILYEAFGRAAEGGCEACRKGTFQPLGALVLGSGTEVSIYPKNAGTGQGHGLAELAPQLDVCSNCRTLRLRATK